jgi:hypothetical protein
MKKYLALIAVALLLSVPVAAFAEDQTHHSNAATAASGAATLNNLSGTITTESLTTAAAAAYTLVLTDSYASTLAIPVVVIDNGTNTAGLPVLSTVTPGAGTITIKIYNLHATAPLNGTLKIRFLLP